MTIVSNKIKKIRKQQAWEEELMFGVIMYIAMNILTILIGTTAQFTVSTSPLRTMMLFGSAFLWFSAWAKLIEVVSRKMNLVHTIILAAPIALLINFIIYILF